MALLKTLQPVFVGAGMPRWQASVAGIQLVTKPVFWSKKPAYLRNLPYTNVSPHAGQIEVRIHFGRLAKEAKRVGEVGTKGKFIDGLPGAAAYIHKKMKGFRAPHALPKEAYPSRARRTYHTIEELERMLGGE